MPIQCSNYKVLLTLLLCPLAALSSAADAADAETRTSKAGKPPVVKELSLQELQEALLRIKGRGTLTIAAAPDPKYRPRVAGPIAAAQLAAHGDRSELPIRVRARPTNAAVAPARKNEPAPASPESSREYIRARASALAPAIQPMEKSIAGPGLPWGYEGENGPQAWARLSPEFGTCATGTRQSPIHIEDDATLRGPAEPLVIQSSASGGSVIHDGRTIQVDLSGVNTLQVRGTEFRLVHFSVHHPAEVRINDKVFAMAVHLVHRNAEGKLAVLVVLLEPGPANPLVSKVWTHMPLDVHDRVQLPGEIINVGELLPQDRRYYQFMGSLSTPPCTEGVLWLVLKQPVTLSSEQLRLFAQMFPMNARPVQPLNGRVVRSAE